MDNLTFAGTVSDQYNGSTTTLLGSSEDHQTVLWIRVVGITISISTVVIGGIGNLTVLTAFVMCRQIMWSKQNIYLFSLTVSDLVTTTLVTLTELDQFLSGRWRHSHAWCRTFLIIGPLACVSSINFVALISRDRMLMVVKGAGYNSYESASRKWLLVLLSVFVCALLLLPYSNLDVVTGVSIYNTGHCGPEHFQNLYLTIVDQIVFTLPQILCMVYFYARVRTYVNARNPQPKKHGRLIRIPAIAIQPTNIMLNTVNTTINNIAAISTAAPPNPPVVLSLTSRPQQQRSRNNVVNSSRRVMKIMNLLVAVVLVTTLPFSIMSVVLSLLITRPTLFSRETSLLWSQFFQLSILFACIGYAMNPILYAFAMPSYRAAIRHVFRVVCRRI